MAVSEPGLFDAPTPIAPPITETMRPGEKRRARFEQVVANGRHPFSAIFKMPLALHPDAPRTLDLTAPGPRCGDCLHRQPVGNGGRSYPKCTVGKRSSHSDATDVRRYWPACRDYERQPNQ